MKKTNEKAPTKGSAKYFVEHLQSRVVGEHEWSHVVRIRRSGQDRGWLCFHVHGEDDGTVRHLTPAAARRLARALRNAADAAEAGPPQTVVPIFGAVAPVGEA